MAQLSGWSRRRWSETWHGQSGRSVTTPRPPNGRANGNDITAGLDTGPWKWLGLPPEKSVISRACASERSEAQLLPKREQKGRGGAKDRLVERQHGCETRQHNLEPSPSVNSVDSSEPLCYNGTRGTRCLQAAGPFSLCPSRIALVRAHMLSHHAQSGQGLAPSRSRLERRGSMIVIYLTTTLNSVG